MLYILYNETLYRVIIYSHHDYLVAVHLGRAGTYELISQNYWWPGIHKTIARYLTNCDASAMIKPVRHALYGLLKYM